MTCLFLPATMSRTNWLHHPRVCEPWDRPVSWFMKKPANEENTSLPAAWETFKSWTTKLSTHSWRDPNKENENSEGFCWYSAWRDCIIFAGKSLLPYFHFLFKGGTNDHVPKVVAIPTQFYSNRVAGGDCHHWSVDFTPVARGAESPRGGQPHQLRQQLQADRVGHSQFP